MIALLFALVAVACGVASAQKPGCCPDGTFTFGDSCYTFIRESQMTWKAGSELCAQRGETLFVPNTMAEFNAVRAQAYPIAFSWLGAQGVRQLGENGDEQDAVTLEWMGNQQGMAEADLPWTIGTGAHGQTSLARCLTYFHSPLVAIAQRVSFLPCETIGITHYVICERNSSVTISPTSTGAPATADTTIAHQIGTTSQSA